MTYAKDGHNYTLRFKKGELLVASLQKFVHEQGIKAGWILGLGGLSMAEIGFYDLGTQEYAWTKYEEDLELTNLTGNIAMNEGKPALHLHATISDASLHAHAGHLKEATVGGTVELVIYSWHGSLKRAKDEETGLNLLQL